MKRTGKKIIYGGAYLALALGASLLIFRSVVTPAPSCSDGKQNQTETGIDCGGSCISCAVARLEAIRATVVGTFSSGSETVALGRLTNPNAGYGSLGIGYEFVVYGTDGTVAERVGGTDDLGPGDDHYVYAIGFKTNRMLVGRVELVISKPTWVPMPARDGSARVTLVGSPVTDLKNGALSVSGTIRNESPLPGSGARVIAIVKDSLGAPIFAAETVSENLGGLESRAFRVFFPKGGEFLDRIDLGKTEVFVY